MFSDFRFRRGGVSRILGISALFAVLFAAGCAPSAPQFGVLTTSAQLPAGVVNVAYATTLTAANGTTPYAWSVTGGALPSGMSLSAAGVLSGTPTASGSFSFTVTVTDSASSKHTVTDGLVLKVNQPPAVTSGNSATFTVGTAGSFTVTASGYPAPTFSETGALPGGVTLNSTTGALSGTPAAGTGGTYPIVITAQNGVTPNATQNFTLTVNQTPAITSQNTKTFVLGVAGTFTVTATGFPAPTLGESGALPTGVTFNAATGVLAGTPAVATQGNYPVSFTAQNGIGANATQNFTLTVGLAPAITSGNSTTFTTGTAGTFTVAATGFPVPTFSETGTLPGGVSLNSTTGVLSGTPAAGTGGTYPMSITAQNGVGSNATQSFTLTVDQAPAITSGNSTTFTVGASGTFTAKATGFPAPTFSETGTLPGGVTLNSTTGVLSGTPAGGTQGTYPITVTAQNGIGANATQSFTLTVDLAPAITSTNTVTFTVGSAGTFTVTATGFPAPTFSETGALPGGVSLNAITGVLSGTPNANTGGTYPITMTAQNGVGSNATQSFTLTVNQAPAITSANSTTFAVGSASSFTVVATGFPAPAVSETGALPSGVTFNASNGILSGTPASGTQTSSPYSISFTAQNGVGSNAVQTFTLTVSLTAPPAFTSSNNTTFTTGAAGSFTVTASGAPSPTFSETGALPSGVSLSPAGALSGTPAAGTGGSYPITITAQNGIAPNATQSFTLTVNQAPVITSGTSATFTENVNGSFTVAATGFPAPSYSETGSLPSGVSLNSSTGVLSGIPGSGTAGSYPITITAQNGVSPNATQAFTLTVNSAPSFTSSSSTTFTVGTFGTFSVASAGSPGPTLGESGTLPNGVSFNSSTGVLSGTPATGAGGVYSITFTANNGVSPNATQNFSLTVDEGPSITSNNTTTFTVGVSGTFTINATGEPAATLSETGALPSGVTFTPNSGGSATLSGTPATGTGGSYPLSITAHNGIGSDSTQSFTLTVITDPCAGIGTGSESLLNGHYAFTLQGFDNGQGTGETSVEPALIAGVLTANGSGAISSGTLDANLFSTGGVQSLSMTGTYKVGSDHRACLTFTTSQGSQHYRASLANISGGVASTGHMINFDGAGPFTAGELRKQDTTAFSTSKVTGNYAFEMATGQENTVSSGGEKQAIAGILKLSTGTLTGGELDINDGGNLEGNNTLTSWPGTAGVTISTGSYTIDATTGRGAITINVTQGSNSISLTDEIYVVSAGDFLILPNLDQTNGQGIAAIGEALQQTGPFTLSGTDVIHLSSFNLNGGPGNTTNPPTSETLIGLITIPSAGNFSFFAWDDNGGSISQQGPQTGTYSIDSAGRMLLTSGGGNHSPLFYLISANRAFLLGGGSGVESGMVEPQTAKSISGVFTGGTIDPQGPNNGTGEFAVTLSSGSVSGTSDDNSNGSQDPNAAISGLTYSIDSTGLGSIAPSACVIGGTVTPCQLIFYVISPTRGVLMELNNGSGPQANPKLQILDQ